ncbi:hypothetical protein J6590_106109, partial [Homalodisca vitripennis]
PESVVESRNCKIMRDSEDEDSNLTEARTFITLDVDWGRNLIEAPLRLGTPRGWNLLEAGIMLSLDLEVLEARTYQNLARGKNQSNTRNSHMPVSPTRQIASEQRPRSYGRSVGLRTHVERDLSELGTIDLDLPEAMSCWRPRTAKVRRRGRGRELQKAGTCQRPEGRDFLESSAMI